VADTCTNCNAILSPTSSSCPSCGTPKRSQPSGGTSGGGFCGSCGTVLTSKFSPCPKCGHVKTTFAPPPQYSNPVVNPQSFLYKSSGTTNLLSILFSILLVTSGVGHLYLGQIGKGLGLMFGGWVLLIVGAVTIFFGVGIILLIGWFILWIYSMIDANKQCQIYNQFVSQNGRTPW